MKTVLFLSGGSQGGQMVLAALEGRRQGLRLVATSSVADDPGLWAYDRVVLVPETAREPAAFRARLLELLREEPVDLVLPCRDDDTLAIAELVAAHPEFAPAALGGEPELARVLLDKWLSFRWSIARGLPFADSHCELSGEPLESFVRRHGYPLIAKPRSGFASRGVVVIDNDDQLARIVARPGTVLQEYLADPDHYWRMKRRWLEEGMPMFHTARSPMYSLELVLGPASAPDRLFCSVSWPTVNRRHLERSDDPRAVAVGRRCGELFGALGWRGPLNVQGEIDRYGELKIHEFNGRFGALANDRRLMGFDEVAMVLERFAGVTLPPTRWDAEPASRVVCQLAGQASHPDDVARLEAEREWCAADCDRAVPDPAGVDTGALAVGRNPAP